MDLVYQPATSPTFATATVTGAITTTGGIIEPATAPAAGRSILVQLGKASGVQLNNVAATTIFTTPGAGFTRCVVDQICCDNFSAVASTASVSYGASGTPTDFAATATMPGATATTSRVLVYPASGGAGVTYGTGTAFVANVTIPQGVATTCDISAWGWYE